MRRTPPLWRRPEPLPGSITTERLVVRWYRSEDAEALHWAVQPQREAYLPLASNRASRGVVERLGVRLEGREREARWVDGVGYDDHLRYGVLAEEWDPRLQRVRDAS